MSTNYDYTGSDYKLTFIGAAGKTRTMLPESYESIEYGPNAGAGVAKGAGKNPRAHATEVNEPALKIDGISHDEADRILKFARANGGILDVQITRQRPETGAKPVTDALRAWKPLDQQVSVSGGEVAAKPIEGMALEFKPDIKNALAI
jgi:hypothetical protein